MTTFKKMISQRRLFTALKTCRPSSPSAAAFNTIPNKISPEPGDYGIFRRHLHLQAASPAAAPPGSGWLLPAGGELLRKLRGMDAERDMIWPGGVGLAAAVAAESPAPANLTVADAKKVIRLSELEELKLKLRQNEKDCVSYYEFTEILEKECSSKDQALQFSKILDESGCVIVLGNLVFLRPDKVIKAIQGLIMPVLPPGDVDRSSTKALEEMEKQKSSIDEKAKRYVRRELWCGLGYLVVQTALMMRLTFWELSWDVMEPICFYVTSMYFMGGYAFFLRTSQEPCFEGIYRSRLSTRQSRLMKGSGFDVERYNELKRACHRDHSNSNRLFTL